MCRGAALGPPLGRQENSEQPGAFHRLCAGGRRYAGGSVLAILIPRVWRSSVPTSSRDAPCFRKDESSAHHMTMTDAMTRQAPNTTEAWNGSPNSSVPRRKDRNDTQTHS